MLYDLKDIPLDKAKNSSNYNYTGDINTPIYIINTYQQLATNENNEECGIVSIQYGEYSCELDIFWDDIGTNNSIKKLVIKLFLIYNNEIINISEELLLSDILKENYIEHKMYEFIIDNM